MTTFTENPHAGGFLMSEANDKSFSRENVTIASGANLISGSVLGQIGPSTGAPTYNGTVTPANTGNFTCGAITESAGAIVGAYRGEFIAATVYEMFDPNGLFLGEGNTGVAFSGGGLGFTITAGGTAAVAGDNFTITVAANANQGKYALMDPAAKDGSQVAVAVLFADALAGSADVKAAIIARNAEVNSSELVWKSGTTTPQQTAAIAQLKAVGILAR